MTMTVANLQGSTIFLFVQQVLKIIFCLSGTTLNISYTIILHPRTHVQRLQVNNFHAHTHKYTPYLIRKSFPSNDRQNSQSSLACTLTTLCIDHFVH